MSRLFPELGVAPRERDARAWLAATRSRTAVSVAWCGFGLASAGAGAAAILGRGTENACLVGFSGTLRPEMLPVGSAVVASHVECHGLGLPPVHGLPPTAAGSQLDVELAADPSMAEPGPPTIPAQLRAALRVGDSEGGILSVAIPSVSPGEASERAAAHPGCLVEEMEAFAVLHAATALGRSVSIIRGVSNVAGERDKASWRIDAAVAAIRGVLDRWLAIGDEP